MQLLLALLLSVTAHAADTLSLGTEGGASVEIQESREMASLKIRLPNGQTQVLPAMGEHVQFLEKDGKSGKIAVRDFDGDGRSEIVVRFTVPPKASHVFVYRYESEQKKFLPVPFADDDHLVADYQEPVEVMTNGIAFETEEWPAADEFREGAPERARAVWKFQGQRFLPF